MAFSTQCTSSVITVLKMNIWLGFTTHHHRDKISIAVYIEEFSESNCGSEYSAEDHSTSKKVAQTHSLCNVTAVKMSTKH